MESQNEMLRAKMIQKIKELKVKKAKYNEEQILESSNDELLEIFQWYVTTKAEEKIRKQLLQRIHEMGYFTPKEFDHASVDVLMNQLEMAWRKKLFEENEMKYLSATQA